MGTQFREARADLNPKPETTSASLLFRWFLSGAGRLGFGGRFTPSIFNFLVTSRCDLSCRHCFSTPGVSSSPAPDLTLEEIRALCHSHLEDILFLVISGGEPFLRPDLPQIVEIFYIENRVRTAVILTSGQHTGSIGEGVTEIFRRCPGLNLAVGIALDGPIEVHDRIRGREGAFVAALETYRTLEGMKEAFPGLSLQICSVLMKENQQSLFELYPMIRDTLRPEKISMNLIRQDPRDPEMLDVNLEAYERFSELLRYDTFRGAIRNKYPFDTSGIITLIEVEMRRLIVRTLLEMRPQLRCCAGSVSAVLRHDGTVGPCEILEPFGNLREAGGDFRGIWFSPQADAVRRTIRAGCFCTHEIDCFLPSIPFTPSLYGRLAALALEWKRTAGWKDVNR